MKICGPSFKATEGLEQIAENRQGRDGIGKTKINA